MEEGGDQGGGGPEQRMEEGVEEEEGEESEESPQWRGWALAEETVDYMNPKEFEVGLTPEARPAGIPEGAFLAIRKGLQLFHYKRHLA